MGVVSLIGACFALIPLILNLLEGRKAKAYAENRALAQVEVDELDRGMRAVDERVQHPSA